MAIKYVKLAQTPFTKIKPGELVVKLDTGDLVAVSVVVSVESNTGNPIFTGQARVVTPDGSSKLDANGEPIVSGFTHTSNPTELTALAGMPGLQKVCALAVLGEDTGTAFLNDPVHQTLKDHASIRTNIASAKAAGTVTTLDSFL